MIAELALFFDSVAPAPPPSGPGSIVIIQGLTSRFIFSGGYQSAIPISSGPASPAITQGYLYANSAITQGYLKATGSANSSPALTQGFLYTGKAIAQGYTPPIPTGSNPSPALTQGYLYARRAVTQGYLSPSIPSPTITQGYLYANKFIAQGYIIGGNGPGSPVPIQGYESAQYIIQGYKGVTPLPSGIKGSQIPSLAIGSPHTSYTGGKGDTITISDIQGYISMF